MTNELLKVKGSCVDFTALPKPISTIGEAPVVLNGEHHFPDCAKGGYGRLKGRPLTIFGVELVKRRVKLDSILAFDVAASDEYPDKTLKLGCFENPKKLLKAIREQLK